MTVDLHIHTNASDGAWAAEKVVRAAAAVGLDVIAIADHDTTAAVPAAVRAAEGQLHVVPAVELTCGRAGGEMHLLGYGLRPEDPAVQSHARAVGERREARMRRMLALLAELGAPVGIDAVLEEAGPDAVLGRPHLARALVSAGHVHSVGQAFERYLADGGPAWAPVGSVPVEKAIRLVHDAGGLAVWAHPAPVALDSELGALVDMGLDGVECYRPRLNAQETQQSLAAAARHGLLATGGSDWHGPWHGNLGEFRVQSGEVSQLLNALGL